MSVSELPPRPNLEFLKKQARKLLTDGVALDASAQSRFQAQGIAALTAKLADALHVIAREHGFDSWPALKLHVETNSEDAIEALTAAVKSNNAASVADVIRRHPALRSRLNEPLPKYGFEAPAIIAAVNHENREMVDVLLDAGANINERSRWWAGSYGVLDSANDELALYLISRGATVDIHAAARLGMLDRVRDLLAADPLLVHARGGDGQLPLHFAKTVDIAALLLDAGSDVEVRDIDHESTALQYMVSIKPYRYEVAKYLIARGAQADILAASALGEVAMVERMLNDDPDSVRTTVNERHFPKHDPRAGGSIYFFGFGFTKLPHMIAHERGHQAVFDLLMQRSPNWLRLLQAAEIGDEPLGARILAQNPQLFTRLSGFAARRIIGAAARNNTRAVELLLGWGWPCNPALDNNQTALHYAGWHGNPAMARALLERSAPVNVFENEHGGSPLAWVLYGSLHNWQREKGNYPEVAKALLAAGAEVPQPEGLLEAAEEVLAVIHARNSAHALPG